MANTAKETRSSASAATGPVPATNEGTHKSKGDAASTLRDLVIAAVILGALFGVYYRHVATQRKAHALAKSAQAAMGKDTTKGYLEAEALLDQALKVDSNYREALAFQALTETILWSESGLEDRRAKAEALIEKITAKDVPLAERFAAVGRFDAATGKAATGETQLVGTLKESGNVAAVVDALAHCERALGKLAEAKVYLKKAADADWRSPRYAADQATAMLEGGDLATAALLFDKALSANGDHLRSLVGRALSDIPRGERLDQSGKALEDVLSRPAGDLGAPLKARALAARAMLKAARGIVWATDADAAIAAAPNTALAHLVKGILQARDHQAAGDAEIHKSIELDAFLPTAYFEGAQALMDGGFADKSLALMKEAAQHLKDSARYHLAYGQLMAKSGDDAGAIKELDKALTMDGSNADALFAKGQVLQSKKDLKGAATFYEKAITARDMFPDAYRQMGNLYLETKDVKGALDMYKEALVRYKTQKLPADRLEAFFTDLQARVARAGQAKLASQFVDEARKLK